jgi:putative RNA 2'-phosphotransferase
MADSSIRLSKYISLLLRHRPELGDLELDAHGWARLDDLVRACVAAGHATGAGDVLDVVAESDKQRFELSPGGRSIRAAQGHSIDVDLGLTAIEPPVTLFHGTVRRFLDRIVTEGLRPMGRTHVHLSADTETARRVGLRRGEPVVLRVAADAMFDDGFQFFRSTNGVWLVDHVPGRYLDVLDPSTGVDHVV